jgi:S1-C subfamily serine protease
MLDLVLCVFVLIYALSGYQQGFIVGASSTAGLLLGGFVGVEITPALLDNFDPAISVSIAALLVVLACAFTGQGLGAFAGSLVRRHVTWRPARTVDALGGVVLSVVAMLLIAWVLGVAASGAQVGALNQEIRDSRVLGAVDSALPGGADRVLATFNSLVDSSRFPRYLEPFTPERITSVRTPSAGILHRAAVQAAEGSVTKVIGSASSCNRTLEGSGFVFASDRVMTNAHVVAGVSHPVVSIDGSEYPATVVDYDPEVDIAVLLAPGLTAPALRFGPASASGDPAAVLGFPENGPYDAEPARIRDEQTLSSPDIYGDGTVRRDTYSIYSRVRAGNSGGPLVDAHGDVIGVIFAASITSPDTGYALTTGQVHQDAVTGSTSSTPVSTGSCAS